ncbi:MAG: hypothetical protein ABIR18_01280 [Chitinophagaceae bacterium]
MKFLTGFVFSLLLYSCETQPKSSFNSKVSEIFFNADLTGNYQTNLAYYRSLNFLTESEPSGWTVYPPLSALRQEENKPDFQSFQFDKHPTLPSEFGGGTININPIYPWKDSTADFVMYFSFKSKSNAKKAYDALINQFASFQNYKKDLPIEEMSVIDFRNPKGNYPGIRFSLDDGDSITEGYIITISVIRTLK